MAGWFGPYGECSCDCGNCNCATGYADIAALWSQIDATATAPLALTPSTEFLASPNGVICGDGLNYVYTESLHQVFTPNRIQFAGPTDCGNDIFGQPMYGLFIFLPPNGSVASGPGFSYGVSAMCVDGVLYYCWEATLGYSAISSSGQFGNPDCHGATWYLPTLPNGTPPLGTGMLYTSTTGDETTTVVGVAWPINNGIAGFTLYELQIIVTKQGCSTDINDIPTSFTLAPAYNPASISVDFTLS